MSGEGLAASERVADPGLGVLLERHLRTRAEVEVDVSSKDVFVQVHRWGAVAGDATGLLPTLDGHLLVDAGWEASQLWGLYVRTGAQEARPERVAALRGLFLGRRVVFRLKRVIARGPAMVGRGSVVRCWGTGGGVFTDEAHGRMLRMSAPRVRTQVRAFLMGRGRRGASLVRSLPQELVEMVVGRVCVWQ